MHAKLTPDFIADALSQSVLDPRSRVLYDICFIQRDHLRHEVVSDKLRMMLQQQAEHGLLPEGISLEAATHRLQRSCVDCWFSAVATAECLDMDLVLSLHKRLMNVFPDLPDMEASTLASRYLHFHFPELFFIHDSRVEAVALVLTRGEGELAIKGARHPAYARFVAVCLRLVDLIAPLLGRRLSPRELDRVLRAWLDQGMALPALSPAMSLDSLRSSDR